MNASTDVNSSAILNPSDPLCFLPAELALQMKISGNILVGTMAVFVWEVLSNILNDYKLLFKHRIRLPTIVYFISKSFCLAAIVFAAVFQETPLTCNEFGKLLDALFSVAISSTSLLFFFRIRAIFDRNPWIIAFFGGFWLGVVGVCLAFVLDVDEVDIGRTRYCGFSAQVKPFAGAVVIIPLINDTLVFFAITWRLSYSSYARRTFKDGIRVLVFGDYLPVFTKAMLLDGQVYYLATIIINFLTVVNIFNDSIPNNFRVILRSPNTAVMNIMACRVFRNTKFDVFREAQISTSLVSEKLQVDIPLFLREGESNGRTEQTGDATSGIDSIAITQEVEHTHDYAAQ